MEARFFENLEDRKLGCLLCPHYCTISPGKSGICGVRKNNDGRLEIPFYGRLSALSMDPVEKKPLYHFYPGRMILSAGFWGCSFKCPFCQNYHISTRTEEGSEYIDPGNLVRIAEEKHSFAIAYTYSEPLVHMEYLLDTAAIARKKGIRNVLVSNGYVNPDPADELIALFDAANIDLKAFNPGFYKKEIKGDLDAVKKFISQVSGKIHLEVTTLVIPGKNDSIGEIEGIARFLASLDPDIPYHLSCYYPTYKYSIPPTPVSTVAALAQAAKKHLHYVYLGNAGSKETNTYCSKCGHLLIQRIGYQTDICGIEAGKCGKCSAEIQLYGVKASGNTG